MDAFTGKKSKGSCGSEHGKLLEDSMSHLQISPNSTNTSLVHTHSDSSYFDYRSATSQELKNDQMTRRSSECPATRSCRSRSYKLRTPHHLSISPQRSPDHSCDFPLINVLPCNPLPFPSNIVLPSELIEKTKSPPSWTRERSRSPLRPNECEAVSEVHKIMGFTSFFSNKKKQKEHDLECSWIEK